MGREIEKLSERIDKLEKKLNGAYDLIRLLQLKIEKVEKKV